MRSFLPFRLVATASLVFLGLITAAKAGGSLSREDFLAEIADERLRRTIIDQFDLADEGRALRAGRHLPNAGERVAPFEILVRPARGEAQTVVLRLESPNARRIVILPCSGSAHYSPKCE